MVRVKPFGVDPLCSVYNRVAANRGYNFGCKQIYVLYNGFQPP